MPRNIFAYTLIIPPLAVLYAGDHIIRTKLAGKNPILIDSNLDIGAVETALRQHALLLSALILCLLAVYILSTVMSVRTIRIRLGRTESGGVLLAALVLGVGAFVSEEFRFLIGDADPTRIYLLIGGDLFIAGAEILVGPDRAVALIETFMLLLHLFTLPAFGFVLFAFATICAAAMESDGYGMSDDIFRLRRLLSWAAALSGVAIVVMAAWRTWPISLTADAGQEQFYAVVIETIWSQAVSFALVLSLLYVSVYIPIQIRARVLARADVAPRDEDGWRSAHGLEFSIKDEIGPVFAVAVPIICAAAAIWTIQIFATTA